MTFFELSLMFEKEFKNKCLNTRLAYGNSVKKLVRHFEDQDIKALRPQEYKGTILDRRVLKHMLRLAVEWGLLDKAPIIKIPKEKVRTRFLDEDEVKLLLKYVKDRDLNLMIRVAIGTGLRKSNLQNLEWGQIDKKMHIKITVKGNKELYIPIVSDLVTKLNEYRTSRLIITKKVFPEKNYDRKLRQYCRDLKLRDISFHTLRHTYGSWLAMGGVDIKTIAELMGHEDIETTQRYIHIASEHKRNAVQTLPKFFFLDNVNDAC